MPSPVPASPDSEISISISSDELLENKSLKTTSATITVRIIKSFEYRTERNLVLHDLNLEITVGELKVLVCEVVQTKPEWKAYRADLLDTLKLYSKAHGAKTSNLIINLDHPEWIFEDDAKTLAELSIENETELSFFNREVYDKYCANPKNSWE